jgi:nitric oxide reductase large subunit
VANTPTAGAGIWSIASIIFMIAAIAGMIFYHSTHAEEGDPKPPKADPLFDLKATPSMKATRKYFYVVIGLILAQVGMGVITAHYAVEGHELLRFPLGADSALHGQPHHPHPVRRAVDCHRLAGHRPLHRAGDFWQSNPNTRSWVSTCCSMPC